MVNPPRAAVPGHPGSPQGTSVQFPSEAAVAHTAVYCDRPVPVLLAIQTKFVLQMDHLSKWMEKPNMSKCISS